MNVVRMCEDACVRFLHSTQQLKHHTTNRSTKKQDAKLHLHLLAPSSGPWGGGTAWCPPGRAWGPRTPPAYPGAAGGCRHAASGRGTAAPPARGSSVSGRWKMHKSVAACSTTVPQEIKPQCACYWDQLRQDVGSVAERHLFLSAWHKRGDLYNVMEKRCVLCYSAHGLDVSKHRNTVNENHDLLF